MLDLVRTKLGIEHALAARRLYVVGAQLLWEVSTEDDVDEQVRHTARNLIVLRDGQYVFRQVIEQYLRQITYDDEYARRLELPRYEVAHIVTDPEVNFGKPYFAHSGTPLAVVRDLLRAGETVAGARPLGAAYCPPWNGAAPAALRRPVAHGPGPEEVRSGLVVAGQSPISATSARRSTVAELSPSAILRTSVRVDSVHVHGFARHRAPPARAGG
jgi:hypothetical protein